MSRSIVDWSLFAALMLSAALNLWLASAVKGYKNNANDVLQVRLLSPGDRIGPLKAYTLDDARATVRYDDVSVPTVLYVFAPNCSWCIKNHEAIRDLAAAAGPRYRFIGVSISDSLDGVKSYLAQSSLPFAVFGRVSLEDGMRYGLGITPQTLVIRPDGAVVKRWTGAYIGSIFGDIAEYFRGQGVPLQQRVSLGESGP